MIYGIKGSTGPSVEKIQKQLNKLNSAGLEPDGKFGNITEQAVKDFQELYGLMPDGIVGDFTYAALTLDKLVFVTRVPPHVKQTQLRCWAASTESWLRTQPHRTNYTEQQIVDGMREDGFARNNGSLPVSCQPVWEDRFGLRPLRVSASRFYAEQAKRRLQMAGIPLLFGIGGSMGHVMVLYGVMVNGLDVQLLVMDPMSPHHPAARSITEIQSHSANITTWMTKMPLFP